MKQLTDEQIAQYRKDANRLELAGRGLLWAEPELIRKVCNGIGAQWMPAKLRAALDALHPSLVLASVIHDLQYWYWDGTEDRFRSANEDFEANARLCAADRYGWYDPRRYLARGTASRYRRLLDIGGHSAACAARAERLANLDK